MASKHRGFKSTTAPLSHISSSGHLFERAFCLGEIMSEKRRVKIAVQADSVEWVLVRFIDDDILSTPLRLDKVIDENSGDDGLEANLQSGDMCLAPYSDGHLYKAKILLRTAEKEKALKDRKILMTANPEREKKGKKSGPKKGEKKSAKRPKSEDCNDENKRTKKEILEEKKARDNSRTETLLHAQDYILKHVRNFDNNTSPSNQATPTTLKPPYISYSPTATAQTNIAPPSTNPPLVSITTPSYPPATSVTPPSFPPATPPSFPPAISLTPPSFPPATSVTPPSFPPATPPSFPPAISVSPPSFPPATSATPSSYPPSTSASPPSFSPATSATPSSYLPSTSASPPSFSPATSATPPSFPPATSATPPSFPPATSATPSSFPLATPPSFQFAANSTLQPETFIVQPLSSPLSIDQPVDQSPAPISCSFTASYPPTTNTATLPPSSSYPPTFNPIHSQSIDLPSTSYQSPFPLSNDFSSRHTNTSDVLGRSLITLNNDCYECSVKDVQIESLKQALNQSTKDNGELLLRVQELEREREKPGSTQEEKDSEMKDHYTPKRGIIVDWSDYQLVDIGKETPPNYERLVEEGEVIVPRQWLTGILGKCKGKGKSFTIKKFIDGFFEPEDLVGKTSVTFVPKNKVAQSLKMYAIKKLAMREADFNMAFNSKAQTAKRAIKFRRRDIQGNSSNV